MLGRVLAVAVLLVLGAGCAQRSDIQITDATTVTTADSTTDAALSERFGVGDVVVESDGQRRLPVWLAADDRQRQRGLMEVTDPALAGRVGMAFWFPAPTTGGFWMRNTRLPLTIVFVGDDGAVVSRADMVPCPDDWVNCPVTRPAGPYRWALEVPTSRWEELGLDGVGRLRLEVGNLNATGSS
jgi:uncharacterized membrane protein (UPF0127 family)